MASSSSHAHSHAHSGSCSSRGPAGEAWSSRASEGAAAVAGEDAAEHRHFHDILHSFHDYRRHLRLDLARRERALEALPPAWRSLLPPSSFAPKSTALQEAVAANADFLEFVAEETLHSGMGRQWEHDGGGARSCSVGGCACAAASRAPRGAGVGAAALEALARPTSSAAHQSKVKSTLHQLVRDWSAEGAGEREACYGVLLRELAVALPVTAANVNQQRVLVPGCGLARLLHDAVAAGYAAQGNEFSLQMLFASHVVLNVLAAPAAVVLHPWVHDPSNHLRPEDMLRGVPIPDVAPGSLSIANPGADMSMTAGDFCGIYSAPGQAGAWDAVATAFFLDTAPVALEYLDVIWHALRPGGVWVNCGPLAFHWQGAGLGEEGEDPRYAASLELSWLEMRTAIIRKGFRLVREATTKSTYAANAKSIEKRVFQSIVFTAIKEVGAGAR